ncbi:MAG: DegV family protein [Omnitrophica WOR_2 bacterium]
MVRIIADTTSGLPPEIARKYNIPVIPQIVNFGNESFIECINLDNATFMKRLRSSPDLPKTAAPPPDWFVREFDKLVPAGEPILCIHPSIELSGTVRSAMVAAKEFPGADIRVIDTRLVSSPLATVVELAGKWAQQGLDADTIEKRVREMSKRCKLYGVVATLEFLARGGRIGGAAAFLGSLLQVKPIITLQDGRVEQFERERTQKHAVNRLKELVTTQIPRDGSGYLSIMHAGVSDEARELCQDLAALLQMKETDIPVLDVPPAIATHAGPGLLGVAFFTAKA